MPHIYVLSPDNNQASGGIKILYRHVDVLNASGYEASVLHQQRGFRCTWFSNDTRVDYLADTVVEDDDFLVIPEIFGPRIYDICKLPQVSPASKKVIFNQNCRYTFLGQDINSVVAGSFRLPYDDTAQFVATMVVSEDSKEYIQTAFPVQHVFRIHNAIDSGTFRYQAASRPRICYMPRKHAEDAIQVLGMLNLRGALEDVEVTAIDGMHESQVADVMRESLLFLSFGYPEGCPLPPAEAMASGCVVVGYDGFGGREYFDTSFSFPVTVGDITGYVRTVDDLLARAKQDIGQLNEIAARASAYVLDTYSSEQERKDILACWHHLLGDSPA